MKNIRHKDLPYILCEGKECGIKAVFTCVRIQDLTHVDMLSSHGLYHNKKCQTHEEHGRVYDQGVKNNGDTFS